MNINELNNEQRRQYIDFRQIADALYDAKRDYRHSYRGSMRWLTRGGRDYFHRKKGNVEKSLGVRSRETETIYDEFLKGREKLRTRIEGFENRIQAMAPVNRALGLGRVPRLPSKIIRSLDQAGLMGSHLLLVGTSSLWGYEISAGILSTSDLVATIDTDFLGDVRNSVRLLRIKEDNRNILKLLKQVDGTFAKRSELDYRAMNNTGFAVDLIRAQDKMFLLENPKKDSTSNSKSDLQAAPIEGLQWLINSPKFFAQCIGEDGLPVPLLTIDPRIFALHKAWVCNQDSRDPIKRKEIWSRRD